MTSESDRPATELVVLVVFVPIEDSDRVRAAMSAAGAGRLGSYRGCSFSVVGAGRFEPLPGATPAIGAVGSAEVVAEERIEAIVPRDRARSVVEAMLAAHPYEEPAWHAYPMLTLADL